MRSPSRHGFAAVVVAAVTVFGVACTPSPGVPPGSTTTTTTTTTSSTTTSSTTSTTTPVTPGSCLAAPSSGLADGAGSPTPEPLTPAQTRADLAAATADASDSGAELVITTIDRTGRPAFRRVDPAMAAAEVARVSDPVVDLSADRPVGLDEVATPAGAPAVTPLVAAAGTSVSNDPLRVRQWAFDALGFEDAWTCGTGAGVTVAVVDSGVDPTHPDLAGRLLPGVSFLAGDPSVLDANGHGTHVAGTIAANAGNGIGVAGVAPGVSILPVRVLDANGQGWESDLASGIVWAVDRGAKVINVSASTTGSSFVPIAAAYAASRNVVVVAAAGNSGPGGVAGNPALTDSVIAVANLTSSGAVSSTSTTGAFVDVAAPGTAIVSTYLGGAYAFMSGTSMATPHVTGVAALLVGAHPGATAAWVRSRIESTTLDGGAPGRDEVYGWGVLQPDLAVGAP